ncbi:MAG: hypothetical protein WCI63_03715 [bacterium]
MDVSKYETANGWFSAMHEKGYDVPIILCQAIEKVMKTKKISFSQAYKQFASEDRIVIKDKVISFE